jgi:hypothetical protein
VKTTPEETWKEKSNFVTSYLNDNKDIAMIPDNRNNDSCQVEDPVEDNMIRNDRLFTAQMNKDGRTKFTTRNLGFLDSFMIYMIY